MMCSSSVSSRSGYVMARFYVAHRCPCTRRKHPRDAANPEGGPTEVFTLSGFSCQPGLAAKSTASPRPKPGAVLVLLGPALGQALRRPTPCGGPHRPCGRWVLSDPPKALASFRPSAPLRAPSGHWFGFPPQRRDARYPEIPAQVKPNGYLVFASQLLLSRSIHVPSATRLFEHRSIEKECSDQVKAGATRSAKTSIDSPHTVSGL